MCPDKAFPVPLADTPDGEEMVGPYNEHQSFCAATIIVKNRIGLRGTVLIGTVLAQY